MNPQETQETRKIGNTEVQARAWNKGDQHRIYFRELNSHQPGQAIWDVQAKEWIKCHSEFGAAFKAALKTAFGL